jgi:hypothetical protein
MPEINDSAAVREVIELRREARRRAQRSGQPIAGELVELRSAIAEAPRLMICKVTSTAPFRITLRPGDDGEVTFPFTPSRNEDYSPTLDDWVLVADLGRNPRYDTGHGGLVVCFSIVVGSV